jgi:hypothetical protein
VTLVVWIVIGIVAIVLLLVRRRVQSARRSDLGSISERWLTEQRTGRDRWS